MAKKILKKKVASNEWSIGKENRKFVILGVIILIAVIVSVVALRGTGFAATISKNLQAQVQVKVKTAALPSMVVMKSSKITDIAPLNGKVEDAAREYNALLEPRLLALEEGRSTKKQFDAFINSKTYSSALSKYASAKLAKDLAVEIAWEKISAPTGGKKVLLVQEPLLLASLTFQRTLEDGLAPSFRTSLPGLPKACHNYIIGEQLFHKYVNDILSQERAVPNLQALQGIAMQMACLSPRDLVLFEETVAMAMKESLEQLDKRGYSSAKPLFLRLYLQPLILVYDASKVRGERSKVYQLLKENKLLLEKSLKEKGFTDSSFYAFHRGQGSLVNLPVCSSVQSTKCVDPIVLLQSLIDPRAVQLGDCSLPGMIMEGKKVVSKGNERYVCPSEICKEEQESNPQNTGSTSAAAGASFAQRMDSKWPSLSKQDLSAASNLCKGAKIPSNSMDVQGACLSIFEDKNPDNKYLECVAGAVGADKLPEIGSSQSLQGVPLGKNCKLLSPGGVETVVPLQVTPQAEEFIHESIGRLQGKLQESNRMLKEIAKMELEAEKDLDELREMREIQGKTLEKAKEVIDEQQRKINEQQKKIEEQQKKIKEHEERTLKGVYKGSVLEAVVNWVASLFSSGEGDCFDPSMCNNECTATGQVIAQVQDCTEKYLKEITAALGKPQKGAISQGPRFVDPRVVKPSPEDQIGQVSAVSGECLPAGIPPGTGTARPTACGLVICQGLSAGIDGCCGSPVASVTRGITSSACMALNCDGEAEVNPQTGQCVCRAVQEQAPGIIPGGTGPGPDPAKR